jgi:chaperonin GroES
MKIRPHNDRVLVKRDMDPEKSPGGIIIPERLREFSAQHGEVLAVGPACRDVKPGDRVIYGRYAFSELGRRGREGDVIIRESDIHVVLEPDVA